MRNRESEHAEHLVQCLAHGVCSIALMKMRWFVVKEMVTMTVVVVMVMVMMLIVW